MAEPVLCPAAVRPRILFVDAYDSFSNNIIGFLEEFLRADVSVIKIRDADLVDLAHLRASYDGIVAGPGPGTPQNPEDVGIIGKLWTLGEQELLPVLGICLGFQSLALAFGAKICRLTKPRHGVQSEVLHSGKSIFGNAYDIEATQYHSLHIKIGHPIQVDGAVASPKDLWKPGALCPDLEPLGWDMSNLDNGAVLMAIKHKSKPFYGVQYHPESICTNDEGRKIFTAWWEEAQKWNKAHPRCLRKANLQSSETTSKEEDSKKDQQLDADITPQKIWKSTMKPLVEKIFPEHATLKRKSRKSINTRTESLGSLTVPDLMEALKQHDCETILLDSSMRRPDIGRYSILGFIIPDQTVSLEYETSSRKLCQATFGNSRPSRNTLIDCEDIYTLIDDTMTGIRVDGGLENSPFWGGFMGYISYEMGLKSAGFIPTEQQDHPEGKWRPDVSFAFIERSVVVDHCAQKVYIQSIHDDANGDKKWFDEVSGVVQQLANGNRSGRQLPDDDPDASLTVLEFLNSTRKSLEEKDKDFLGDVLENAIISVPNMEEYESKVRKCQDYIKAGESYELCLTDQATVALPRWSYAVSDSYSFPWMLYKRLRKTNPGNFASYLRLEHATIVGSSPERFLKWDRTGTCQMRPIKGTVKRDNKMTKRLATEILSSSKERAENLMIVDLIRHDLAEVVGAANVSVPNLMTVEESHTVYSLVSVIEAKLPNADNYEPPRTHYISPSLISKAASERMLSNTPTGLTVLAATLPPGSMTGAPKRRSCQLLRGLEGNRPRGIYSGVIGYLDIGGGGDFSVVIRSAYKWHDEIQWKENAAKEEVAHEIWRVGAGGAVTSQSDPHAEMEEMRTKLNATLAAFRIEKKGLTKHWSSTSRLAAIRREALGMLT